MFFPEDPFHKFKNQALFRKLVLGLEYLFPILQWGPNYRITLLRSDVSGLTIASLAIPQGISYAKLANLPPIIRLYSSFVPPLIYSILGISRHLSAGPVSIASLVMATMISEKVSHFEEPALYLKLAFTATFFAGLFQARLGLLRLGFILDFLSKTTLVGFTAGAAVIISLQQLKGLLGLLHFSSKMQILPVLSHVFHHTKEVGKLPEGLNPLSTEKLFFRGPYLDVAIKTGIVTGILSLTSVSNTLDGTQVGVSVFKILLHIARPKFVVFGKIAETHIYQDLDRYKEARRVRSFLILGVESPIYFANSNYLQERILRLVREEDERIQANTRVN
ncbi:hypothetical protein L1049_005372 [Liquidambar formosana]|uniref:STAS domain-containing protein n=1 Tax=Liquidambar formosana TaxID=63359 RepID=A0AAP0RVB1_LIQFO